MATASGNTILVLSIGSMFKETAAEVSICHEKGIPIPSQSPDRS